MVEGIPDDETSLTKVSLIIYLVAFVLPALKLGGDRLFGWQAFLFAPLMLLPGAWSEPWYIPAGILGTAANALYLAGYATERLRRTRSAIWGPFALHSRSVSHAVGERKQLLATRALSFGPLGCWSEDCGFSSPVDRSLEACLRRREVGRRITARKRAAAERLCRNEKPARQSRQRCRTGADRRNSVSSESDRGSGEIASPRRTGRALPPAVLRTRRPGNYPPIGLP
jgi:hypothetical protein